MTQNFDDLKRPGGTTKQILEEALIVAHRLWQTEFLACRQVITAICQKIEPGGPDLAILARNFRIGLAPLSDLQTDDVVMAVLKGGSLKGLRNYKQVDDLMTKAANYAYRSISAENFDIDKLNEAFGGDHE